MTRANRIPRVSDSGYSLDTHRPMHCTGPCDQGRSTCPCPASCHQQADDASHVSGALAWPVYVVAAVMALAAAWHFSGYLAPIFAGWTA